MQIQLARGKLWKSCSTSFKTQVDPHIKSSSLFITVVLEWFRRESKN